MKEDIQKFLAEVTGTFIVVGVGCGVIVASGGDALSIALGFGLAWITALYTLGRVTGGHFNPALSLAAFLDRVISAKDLVVYWVAQVAGALGAMLIYAWIFNKNTVATMAATFPDNPVPDYISFPKALVTEAILVTILVVAFLALTRSQAHTKYLGMGFALVSVTLLGFNVTGAAVNPARVLAPVIVGGSKIQSAIMGYHANTSLWVYCAGAVIGAVAGWILYRVAVKGDMNFADDLAEIKDSVM